ncbi:MAG: glycosyltransferase [Rhodanobacteraceae bacterium]
MRGAALIVLAWNKWPLTMRCIDSLLESDLDQAEVIVVDNGSTDETPHALEAYADRVRILRMPENLGFVRGMNAGIAAARADDDVVLLNNDLLFTQRDWLGRLRDAAYAKPENGIVGCRLLGPEAEGRIYHDGAFIEPDRLWGQQTESGLVERDVAQYTRLRRVQGIAFALAYIRRDCLDRIGVLDTAFHSYFEDTDYCLRAADFGIASVVAGAVTLRHDQHGSTVEDQSFRTGLFAQSRATFASRWQQRLRDNYRGTLLWQGTTRSPSPFARFARDYVRRLDARGVRTVFEPVANELHDAQDFRLETAAAREWPGVPAAALVCAPATEFVHAHARWRAGIGLGDWDRVPADWARGANTLDRLFVPDTFQADAFRSAGVKIPIAIVPLGVDRDYFHPDVPAPRHPRGHFVFLAIAERLARDAPDLLVETFRRTFRADEPVELLVHVRAGEDEEAITRTLAPLVGNPHSSNVRVLQGWGFPDHQRAQLLASADAYVSVRRGGGWDPFAAEAIATGKILIAGDFGSQAELARKYGHAVAHARLAEDPSHPGSHWAEPDPDSLIAHLRDVYQRRRILTGEARARAADFSRSHDIDASADLLVNEIERGGTFAAHGPAAKAHRPSDIEQSASGQIIVLGMHRSGTSSVAGLLARMGVWPGANSDLLIGPDNPRGHYELAELHTACVRRLASAGGDWKRPPATAPAAAVDAFRRAVAGILDALDSRRPWFIKEPRLCLLARELLPLLTRPVFVHVVRDPLEVADSLAARDGMGIAQALELWETYTRRAFAASRGWPRVMVEYDALMADPVETARRLHDALGAFGVPGLVLPDAAEITAWIEPSLHRHHADSARRVALSAAQRALLAAIEDRSILHAGDIDEDAVNHDAGRLASARAGR